jgi:prephenate dehydrogenase
MNFGTVAILGPGLIGGSLALALAERGLAKRLMIYARSPRALDEIRLAGVDAELTQNPSEAVSEADVVILCLPVESLFALVCPIAHLFKPTALVTDVGSVKGQVERDLAPLFKPNAHWIGSHPMAGSEKSGFSAARANLFQGATVVITPTPKTSLLAENRAKEFWEALGGRVASMPPEVHDDCVAQISHLPHLIASALVNQPSKEALKLVGSGFRDTTRVASGAPDLWTEILSSNSEAVASHLHRLIQDLCHLEILLKEKDAAAHKSALLEYLQKAQMTRFQLFDPKTTPQKLS